VLQASQHSAGDLLLQLLHGCAARSLNPFTQRLYQGAARRCLLLLRLCHLLHLLQDVRALLLPLLLQRHQYLLLPALAVHQLVKGCALLPPGLLLLI
jgi:hypothetical protein